MKRFALLLIVLLAVSVFADYATNVTVVEEVDSPAVAPVIDDAIDEMVDLLVNNSTESLLAEAPVNESDAVIVNETVETFEVNVFDESSLADELAAKEVPVEVPIVEEVPVVEPIIEVPVVESDSVSVVEEVASPAVAPLVDDALDVMADRLVANESDEVPVEEPVVEEGPVVEEVPAEVPVEEPVVEVPEEPVVEEVPVVEPVEEIIEEVPFGPTGGVVVEQSDNVAVIEEVTSAAVAPIVEDALDNLVEDLANITSVQTGQLVKPPSELPAVFDAVGRSVDSDIAVSGSTV
ncbi:MAG: hypothetical protein NTW67_03495, partial [Candidatus Woesearchaeota archaeon]|nr:hypothetical protein [Candidatus Woesearchaeota archaeon]